MELRLIGPLQTNKAEDAVALFDVMVETIMVQVVSPGLSHKPVQNKKRNRKTMVVDKGVAMVALALVFVALLTVMVSTRETASPRSTDRGHRG